MSELIGFRTIQKFRYFLAGVFPFLARPGDGGARFALWLQRYPRVVELWRRANTSALGTNVKRVASTFALGSYGSEQLDWTRVPRDSIAGLRTTILVAALLCLLVPLAVTWIWPPLSQEAISGTPGGAVAGWSVLLWLIALSLGWSCLLAGTAAASRLAFLPSLALFIYFSMAMVAALPKSWWSLLVPAQAALALVFCETRASHERRWDVCRGLATSVLGGTMTAFVAIVVIPTPPWFRGRLLLASLALGTPLGIGLWRIAWRRHMGPLRIDVVLAALTLANLLLLLALSLRGSLTAPAGAIQAFAIEVTGYLWPLYFFIGAGVVFKVLRQTQTVQRVTQELVPSALFVPLTFVLLVLATMVPWVKPILLTPAFPWPGWVTGAATGIYDASSWVWQSSLARYAMDSMKWVLLAALLAATWALIQRRLTSGAMAGLMFVVTLVGFAVFQYHFQAMGFTHTPRNTAFSLFIFAAFVLWLVHKTTLKHLIGSSRWWPQAARVALYGALLMFVLLPIHARTALHDTRLTNEMFLYLFFGVINFGLPYYLYVYASRRFKALPVSATATLGFFFLGAVLSVPLIIADRAVVAGSLSGAWGVATAQTEALLQGQRVTATPVFLPAAWVVARGLLGIAALTAVGYAVLRRTRGAPGAIAFSIIAVAAGLACFANRGVELPLLPPRIVSLIAPLNPSSIVDAAFVARQLAFMLPALLLALVFAAPRRRAMQVAGVTAALLVHISIGLLWPTHEAWLRSTGVFFAAAGVGFVAFILLAGALRNSMDAALQPAAKSDGPEAASEPLLRWSELRWCAAVVLVLLSAHATYKALAGRLVEHTIPGSSIALRLPLSWTRQGVDSAAGTLRLTGKSWSDTRPLLWTELRPSSVDSTRMLLQRVALETSQQLANYEATRLEPWDQFYPGALALDFRYYQTKDDENTSAVGTTVLAPLPNGRALLATIIHAPSDPARRWDLALAIQALPR